MKFTTGTKEIYKDSFTIKRTKDNSLELDYGIEIGKQVSFDKGMNKSVFLYHNVPAEDVKIGEDIYNAGGKIIGYRAE